MTDYLWTKSSDADRPDAALQQFLSGEDLKWDRYLFEFDIAASQAHARGLQRIGILTDEECDLLTAELTELLTAFRAKTFRLEPPQEDAHSAIESWLEKKLSDVGRKIHTGRSRNDQVQVALRLYLRAALDRLRENCTQSAGVFLDRAGQTQRTPMPGYTHLQRAVPSTVEMWLAAYAEAFIDAAELASLTRHWLNASPLGTAAGYGVNLRLDRLGVAAELNFDRLQINPIHVQNSRGQIEFQVLACFAQATLTLRRFAWDVSLFACQEFDFIRLPSQFTTGSSLMPNKSNPDTVELLRAQHAVVQGALSEVQALLSLPAGYHRDLQLTKAATIRAVESSLCGLQFVPALVLGLQFQTERMRAAISPDMYTTDVALDRVQYDGMAFRDAYRQPIDPNELARRTPEQSISARVSPGSCNDLMLEELKKRLSALGTTQSDYGSH